MSYLTVIHVTHDEIAAIPRYHATKRDALAYAEQIQLIAIGHALSGWNEVDIEIDDWIIWPQEIEKIEVYELVNTFDGADHDSTR